MLVVACIFSFSRMFSNLTLNHIITTLNDLEKESLLKTEWEKEKILVTSIFSSPEHEVLSELL